MSVNSDIYDALAAFMPEGTVFDTTVPDKFQLTDSMIVFQELPELPEITIDNAILGYEQRWQVSVRATDLTKARALKRAVIAALHNLTTASIQLCVYDNCPGVIAETDLIPPEYHYPIDFTISI